MGLEYLVAQEAQRLVELTTRPQDIRNLALRDRLRAQVPEPFEDLKRLFAQEAQRLIELATQLQDVGNPALRHRLRAHVPEPLEGRKHLFAEDAQRLVEPTAHPQDVGNLALRHRLRASVPQPLIGRQFFFRPDPQRLVELSPRLQDVREPARRQRFATSITDRPKDGRRFSGILGRFLQSTQLLLDLARLEEQTGIRPGGLRDALQMRVDLGQPAFARVAFGAADEQPLLVYRRPRLWRVREVEHRRPPGPEVGRVVSKASDRAGLEPDDEGSASRGGERFSAVVERPQRCHSGPVQPALDADKVDRLLPGWPLPQFVEQRRRVARLLQVDDLRRRMIQAHAVDDQLPVGG
ncbi:MAG: hypothetical protein FAZ92_03775 [Accumulibacter sp.]|nr:MAG: hypothetical protein FAZ92_03775 [Accumulibacter sp.]